MERFKATLDKFNSLSPDDAKGRDHFRKMVALRSVHTRVVEGVESFYYYQLDDNPAGPFDAVTCAAEAERHYSTLGMVDPVPEGN